MISQYGIVVFGVLAVWLVNHHEESWSKYGPVFGLLSQPFWFYTAFSTEQWGIFAISFVYTWSWWRGFYNRWVR